MDPAPEHEDLCRERQALRLTHPRLLKLLKDLVLNGRVIIGDAMFCQREVCQEILDGGGHYLVVVKENQPTLLREIEAAFANEAAFSPLRGARIP